MSYPVLHRTELNRTGQESLLAQNKTGNQKGLRPSMLVPILTTHDSEHTIQTYRNQK